MRPLLVVVDAADRRFGLTVDAVERVEALTGPLTPLPSALASAGNSYLTHLFQRPDGAMAFLLQAAAIPCE